MRRKKNVFFRLEVELFKNIRSLDFLKICVKHFRHGRTRNVRAFFRKSAIGKISSRMFAIRHVDVGNYIDDSAVGLLGQTLVLATVSRFHVENGDVQPLRRNRRKAGIGVAKNEQCVGFYGVHQLIGAVNDVSNRRAEVVAHRVHIHFGIGKFQVFKEHAVQVIVVILPRMR